MLNVTCIDCGRIVGLPDWEPTLIPLDWAYESGRHAAICRDCIADVYACMTDYFDCIDTAVVPSGSNLESIAH